MKSLDLRKSYCGDLEIQNDQWPDRFKNDKGIQKLSNTIENLKFLMEKLGIKVKYNVISKDIEIHTPNHLYGPFDDGKNAAMDAIVSECNRYQLPKAGTKDFLNAIGYQNQYNPVLDWITSKKHDGGDYVKQMCDTVTARNDFDNDFKNVLIKKWLISCVAMCCNDQAKLWSKGVLVFQGEQDLGKTYWFWKLFSKKNEHFGKEGVILKPDNKDSVVTAVSHWIIELGELDATFKKADIAHIKAFLTNKSDKLRRPFGRKDSVYPRRTAIFGSVNPREFLKDETGNSRFWVIPCNEINFRHDINMQQMWAEVYEMFKSGEEWFLNYEESKQLAIYNEYSRELSPVEESIISRLGSFKFQHMTATDVLRDVGFEYPTKSDRNTAASVLRKHCGDSKPSKNGRVFKVY